MRIPYKIVDEGSFVIPNFDKYLKDNEEHWDYVNIVGDTDPGFPIYQGVPTFETIFAP